ncbi:MAG: hypothetical protein LBQ50_02395, partial [Planctomycetaceae bacterium]|nr:hypothetical protein [Planctomycetaceae bacterium]
ITRWVDCFRTTSPLWQFLNQLGDGLAILDCKSNCLAGLCTPIGNIQNGCFDCFFPFTPRSAEEVLSINCPVRLFVTDSINIHNGVPIQKGGGLRRKKSSKAASRSTSQRSPPASPQTNMP